MYGKIVVVGSTNTDFVFTTNKFPAPGETVIGTSFNATFGGKGANQAVAARLLGANVLFISALGNDKIGTDTIQHFNNLSISSEYIRIKEGVSSGTACILVNADNGENMIVVSQGANGALCPDDIVTAAPAFADACMIILQAEIPIETIEWTMQYAKRLNIPVLFNPAPVPEGGFSTELLRCVSIFTPNEREIIQLFPNIDDIDTAARKLLDLGIETVIVTRGREGASAYTAHGRLNIPAYPVQSIDTVGAGDTFTAALATAIVEGKELAAALEFANTAAALCTTKHGAQTSMPTREEVNEKLLITTL